MDTERTLRLEAFVQTTVTTFYNLAIFAWISLIGRVRQDNKHLLGDNRTPAKFLPKTILTGRMSPLSYL